MNGITKNRKTICIIVNIRIKERKVKGITWNIRISKLNRNRRISETEDKKNGWNNKGIKE